MQQLVWTSLCSRYLEAARSVVMFDGGRFNPRLIEGARRNASSLIEDILMPQSSLGVGTGHPKLAPLDYAWLVFDEFNLHASIRQESVCACRMHEPTPLSPFAGIRAAVVVIDLGKVLTQKHVSVFDPVTVICEAMDVVFSHARERVRPRFPFAKLLAQDRSRLELENVSAQERDALKNALYEQECPELAVIIADDGCGAERNDFRFTRLFGALSQLVVRKVHFIR